MAFVLLLVMSIGTFLQVETKAGQARASKESARQYALLALQLAAGDLQKYVGLDQRATAPAGILDYTPEDEDGAGLPEEPRWVGVWDSRESGLLSGDNQAKRRDSVDDKALTWLVSGNRVTVGNIEYTPRSFSVSNDTIAIAELGDMDQIDFSSNLDTVNVPLVDVLGANDRVVARYAYWVDEENTKGRIDYIDSERSSRLAEERQSFPTKGGLEGLLLNGSAGSAFIDNNEDGYELNGGFYEKMLGLETLSWLEPDKVSGVSDLAYVTPHLSTVSMGVLANSRDGGLKKDLSFGLSKGATDPASDDKMFPDQGLAAGFYDPGGPLWGQLRDYVNIRSDGAPGAALSVEPYPVDGEGAGIFPVINRFQFFVYGTFYDKGAAVDVDSGLSGRNLGIRLFFIPAVVLYNPYNVPLAARDYHIRFHTNSGHYFTTKVDAPDVNWAPGTTFNGSHSRNDSVEKVYNSLNFIIKAGQDIAPGQALVYSPKSMAVLNGQNHLEEGFVPGIGFFSPAKDAGGTELTVFVPDSHLDFDGQWTFVADAADHYTIGFGSSRNIFEGGIFLSRDSSEESQITSGSLNSLQRARGVGLEGLKSLPPPKYGNVEIRKSEAEEINDNIAIDSFSSDFPAFGWTHSPAYPSLSHWSPAEGDTLKDTRKPIWTTFNILGPNSQENADSADRHTDYDRITAAVNTLFPGNYKSRPATSDIYADAYSIPLATGAEAFVGFSDEPGRGGYDRLTLIELPESVADYSSIAELSSIPLRIPFTHALAGQINQAEQPMYAIGNSYAPATMDSEEVAHESNWGGGNMVHYDYSYLLNEALWDDYFFSGYDSDGSDVRPYFSTRSAPAQYGYRDSSAHLMLQGAFNVNSVSVPAWAHLLSMYFGEDLDSTTGGTLDIDDKSLFSRFKAPLKSLIYDQSSNDETSAEAVGGARALTRKEINNLAEEIVEVVKTRGPFLSLADFINRSIDPDLPEAFRARGALQSAIDEAQLEGTSTANTGFDTTLTELELYPNPAAMALPAGAGLPGFLMQSDLLSRIGQFLITRSDTYTVNFYAETVDPISGEVSSISRGQAIVQRRPEWVDTRDEAQDAPAQLVNQRFGRRLEVTQINWIQ